MSTTETIQRSLVVQTEQAARRLDQVVAEAWPDFSRSRLAGWIRSGELRVDGKTVKPKFQLSAGQTLELDAEQRAHESNPQAQPMELQVLHEDADCLVINKPPGLVVHPGSGNRDGTLVHGLLHYDPALDSLPRAGLVHRLDKDTSGCLLIARSSRAHRALVEALKQRQIDRHYRALVWGHMIAGGSVEAALGRHPVDRRQQVVRADGRAAVTHYRVDQRFAASTLVRLKLETGRTHQIRVHMRHINFPIVGDPMYGRRGSPAGLTELQREAWRTFGRQALHAFGLSFQHPVSGEVIEVESPLPADFTRLLDVLQTDAD